jgi:hypothetical protein
MQTRTMCCHHSHTCEHCCAYYNVRVTAADGAQQPQPQQQPSNDSSSSSTSSGSSGDSAAPVAAVQLTTGSAAVDASQQLGQQVCRYTLRVF